jgi:uncharacterized protein (DUF362 family)
VKNKKITRREFLEKSAKFALGAAAGSVALSSPGYAPMAEKPVVSIAKIKNGNIAYAVEEAIDLLGGIKEATKGKERIMLKPNLVSSNPRSTTKPEVIKALAQLMKKGGKEVLIGEGSAAAPGFNVIGNEMFRTTRSELLDKMQQYAYDRLGYTELAESLHIPLVNLHTGEMAEVQVPNAFVFDKITLHRSLIDIDLLCSVPMMKTHTLAHVTLGMKNLIGVYPGTVYQSYRGLMHDTAAKIEPSGTAVAIVDMVRANKLGLVVVDASIAMEGEGPSYGKLVKMNLIIAGTNPLATDMVAANCMGFQPSEIAQFTWANKAGLKPAGLDEIEVRGKPLGSVRRSFKKPSIYTWEQVRQVWGVKEI